VGHSRGSSSWAATVASRKCAQWPVSVSCVTGGQMAPAAATLQSAAFLPFGRPTGSQKWPRECLWRATGQVVAPLTSSERAPSLQRQSLSLGPIKSDRQNLNGERADCHRLPSGGGAHSLVQSNCKARLSRLGAAAEHAPPRAMPNGAPCQAAPFRLSGLMSNVRHRSSSASRPVTSSTRETVCGASMQQRPGSKSQARASQ